MPFNLSARLRWFDTLPDTDRATMLARILKAHLLALWVALGPLPASADDLSDFAAAVERAAAQYHFALRTLETSGRDETAAEVRLFRQEWQHLADRLDHKRPAEFEGDDFYARTITEVDMALVAAMIVIDIGSREAARSALQPIGDTLIKLRERAERR
jgi:hypothetical protein